MAKPIFDENGKTSSRGAARFLDISEMQVSQALRKGALKATKDEGGKWVIDQAALEEYQTRQPAARGMAAQGRFKATLWTTEDEFKALAEAGYNIKKVGKKEKASKGEAVEA